MSWICLSVSVALLNAMNLNSIFVLLVSSVVITSGSSCDINKNVTVQNPKYFKSDEGFFLM